MKRWLFWLAAVVAVVVAVVGVSRVLSARQTQQNALKQATAAAKVVTMDIAADEVWTVRRQTLVLGVPVSGALRATRTATIKARVSGELQGLVVREGDTVRAGQEVARIDAVEMQARLRQAQQQAEASRSQADISQRQYDNNRALVDQGFISRTALDVSQASLQAARSSHQAALAGVDLARKSLADTVLRSPLDGQVAQRLAQNGERVAIDTRVLEIVDLAHLEVEALLGPADSVNVRVGQGARLTLEGSDKLLTATVVRINPSAQTGTRSVPVYLQVDNGQPSRPLRQGLFVQGTLDTGTAEVLAVPLDAVRTDKPAPYVQVAEQGRVAHRPVQMGARSAVDGQTLVAVEGLSEGAQVLSARVGALPEGTALRMPQSAATPVATPASTPTPP